MAVEVRIPTILRTYTGGEKAVSGEGSTLSELIENLEASHPGLKERLIDGEDLRRVVNGDQVVVLPAVAGGSR